jgi:hypothetical protein
MDPIILRNKSTAGEALEATFLPDKGMNLISYKWGDFELIDQSTRPLFEERFAGLGALIGPHFYRRAPQVIPPIKDESLFPHIARVKAKGTLDPFSHGIGRYAPWKAEASSSKVKAVLTGKDEWNGVALASLEGQNFKLEYTAELTPDGLQIDYSVVSDSDSVVGLHYYYALPEGRGVVSSDVKSHYYDGLELKEIPADWDYDARHLLRYDLSRPADFNFHPQHHPLGATITLDAVAYQLQVKYSSVSEENSWQLYHPEGASFVCIEPLSAQNPRRPNLTTSGISVLISVKR